MCEYCGCQAVTVIDELTREHELVVNMIGDVRAAHGNGDIDRMAEAARRMAAVLEPHTAVEEEGLFPVMAQEFPDQIAALESEHRGMEAVLAEAAGATPTDPGWPDRFLLALEALRGHVLREQDGVFPAALSTLETEEWRAAEAVRARVGGMLSAAE